MEPYWWVRDADKLVEAAEDVASVWKTVSTILAGVVVTLCGIIAAMGKAIYNDLKKREEKVSALLEERRDAP